MSVVQIVFGEKAWHHFFIPSSGEKRQKEERWMKLKNKKVIILLYGLSLAVAPFRGLGLL
jgi:hypothetical protein